MSGEPDGPMFFWLMKYVLAGPLVHSVFRPWVVGIANLPESGPYVLASNHLSFMDSVVLPLVLPGRMCFLAKSDYFTGKGIMGWLVRNFMYATGQIPIDRSGGKASEASLNAGLSVLADRQILGIYPEGTRSHDGRLYRGRTGVARMILEGRVPVIPVAMIGTERVMPIGSRWPRVRRIGVIFGKPLDFGRFASLASDRFILRSVTDEIMYELDELSGQEYVDVYGTSVKERAA